MNADNTSVLLAVFAAFNVGISDFMSRINGRYLDPLRLTLAVTWLGLLWTAVFAVFVLKQPLVISADPWLWLAGVFNVGGLIILYIGIRRGPLSAVLPAASLSPAFSAVMWAVAGRPPSLAGLLGIVLSVLGLVIIGIGGNEQGHDRRKLHGTVAIGLLAAAVLATRMFMVQSSIDAVGIIEIMLTVRLAGGLFLVMLTAAMKGNPLPAIDAPGRARLRAGLLLQSLAETAGVSAVIIASRGSFKTVAPALFSCSVLLTIFLARWILREKITSLRWLGIAVAVAGAVILSLFTVH